MANRKWSTADSGRLIRKAAQIMSDRGHSIGWLKGPDGTMCVRGATAFAYSGNPYISGYVEDLAKISDLAMLTNMKHPTNKGTWTKNLNRMKRNKHILQALSDFRTYLQTNDLVEQGYGVEWFNDKAQDGGEVIRWMHKFADEVDPQ